MTSNKNFNGTPSFNVECLINGIGYRHTNSDLQTLYWTVSFRMTRVG